MNQSDRDFIRATASLLRAVTPPSKRTLNATARELDAIAERMDAALTELVRLDVKAKKVREVPYRGKVT